MAMTGDDAPPLAAGELRREARKLFGKMTKDDGYLALSEAASKDESDGYGLFTRRNAYARPISSVTERVMRALRKQDWITENGEGQWRLTEEGLAWMRRELAGGDPFREQHQLRGQKMLRDEAGMMRSLVVDEAESPLAWLHRRKDRNGAPLITEPQFQAGERLRADFERAQLGPNVTADWNAPQSSRRRSRGASPEAASISDHVLAAKQRLDAALEAVGPELSGILIDICCYLMRLSDSEKNQGWPLRSGKVVLQIALTRLARHYGLITEADDKGRRRLRSWGDGSHRPNLDAWR